MYNATITKGFDELQLFENLFDDNRLSVNVDKCGFMLLGTYQAL